jgi:hypothetical protein
MLRLTIIVMCTIMLSSCGTIGYGIALMESISEDLSETSSTKKK